MKAAIAGCKQREKNDDCPGKEAGFLGQVTPQLLEEVGRLGIPFGQRGDE